MLRPVWQGHLDVPGRKVHFQFHGVVGRFAYLVNHIELCNFAYAELYLPLSTLFRRFDLQLFETYRKRDIDHVRDCFLGEPDPQSPGVRVKVTSDRFAHKPY
jgi:hypothetical protein